MYDKDFNVIKKEDIIYPCLFVYPQSGQIAPEVIQRTYRVAIADRVQIDQDNQIDVETDTELILMDVFEHWLQLGQNERFVVQQQAQIIPFFDNLVDEVTGHYIDFTIEEFREVNDCSIPINPNPTPPPVGCLPAILTVNSATFASYESGSTTNILIVNSENTNLSVLLTTNKISAPDEEIRIVDEDDNVIETIFNPAQKNLKIDL